MTTINDSFRKKLFEQLSKHEGVKLEPYKDSKDYWTIGIGHCIDSRIIGSDLEEKIYLDAKIPITLTKVIELFNVDLDKCIFNLDHYLYWWKYLPDLQKCIVIDMVFNLGLGNFLHFKNMLAALYDGNNVKAAIEMVDSDWYRDLDKLGSERAKRLTRWMRIGIESW